MIVYFSGTGNSKYCADMLADILCDEKISAFNFIRDGIAAELLSEKPWVFVAPTYAWRLPRIFSDFIRSGSFAGSKDAYFIMTCGSEIGNAHKSNTALCKEKRFNCKGTLEVIMPENYIALFNAPDELEASRIIDAAAPVIKSAASCIKDGRTLPIKKANISDRLRSGIVNTFYYRFIVKADKFTA